MRQALTILYSRIVVQTLLIVGVVALVGGRLRRRLQVSQRQRTRAPLLWLVSLTADARLHRRLRNLGIRAGRVGRGGPRHRRRHGDTAAQRLAIDLEDQIILLDERLVDSRTCDLDEKPGAIRAIRDQTDRVEALTERVAVLIQMEDSSPDLDLTSDPIGAIAARVEELEKTVPVRTTAVVDTSATRPESSGSRTVDSPP